MTGQWVATWTSFEGAPLQTFFSLEKEKMRQRVKDWIRQSSPVDAVVDFDRALADPQEPVRLKREFDCGDHLHPSDAGYAEMARHVDPALFDSSPPQRRAIDLADASLYLPVEESGRWQ